MAKRRVYVVFKGRQPGIYNSWPECHQQVQGFTNNLYQAYSTIEEAEIAYVEFVEQTMRNRNEANRTQNTTIAHTSAQLNNEWRNGFILGCLFGFLLMGVFTYLLYN